MRNNSQLEGIRFGSLTVISLESVRKYTGQTRKYWLCRCDCGKESVVGMQHLTQGKTSSCGCKSIELARSRVRERNQRWMGDKVGVAGIHSRVRKMWGKADRCEECGRTDRKMYEWSNSNHKYSENRDEWRMLCRSCHQKHDYGMGLRMPRS